MPSPASRESMTLVSSWLQNGQCIRLAYLPSLVDGETSGTARDLPRTRRTFGSADGIEDVGDPAGHLLDLGFA
jgi:hypothetical protein